MTKTTKAVLTYGGILAGVGILYLVFKKKSSASAIVTAKNNIVAGTPAAPVTTAPSGGNQYVAPPQLPVGPVDTSRTVMQTPAGQISTAPLYFAIPTADTLSYAPQNIY